MIMGRLLFLLLLAASMLDAMTIRLYLKDGGYHTVSEYKVLQDRVRYFSTERGDWEEIPLDLVDLKKTRDEEKSMVESTKAEALAEREESKAEARVPQGNREHSCGGRRVLDHAAGNEAAGFSRAEDRQQQEA